MKSLDKYAAPTAAIRKPSSPPCVLDSGLQPAILAVDDDPATRQLIAGYLGDNEFRVITVATGAEMVKVLEERAIDLQAHPS